jgi:hypothetical protein
VQAARARYPSVRDLGRFFCDRVGLRAVVARCQTANGWNLYLTDATVEDGYEGIKTQAWGTTTRQERNASTELRDPLSSA